MPILLLVACNSKAEPSVELPDFQCYGELPKQLQKNIGEYRLAQGSDFVKSIRSFDQEDINVQLTCTIFTADFNRDSLKDYAVLLVSQENAEPKFQLLLNQGKGKESSSSD
ncbi:MAG: hypothetical protein F6J94_05845 [Moorea sp. SIO1F2]|uniref:hypothetical protein n=1 Tax=unclassified Moorena TaxID=2683338 RepID=UPI0013B6BFCC|nr:MULTISPECIES: hypothetical protein [unclassified Moorena]NEO49550.1 hypothetical protein [Moorena sp. SIO4A3]NEO61649.1 hypothetical protein [Moorena sp. SIO4G2]NEO20309.1 hypothetical protein [Moorena sp. SIO4A5]NEP24046.1 hypothetical protein [Moorena sp. SIO3I6]NEQ60357.1 hypothetical protein [Moorena sp. SIO4A1]